MATPTASRAAQGALAPPAPAFRDFVIADLARWQAMGRRVCLVTLVDIDGGSPRPLGAQMAVAADGEAVGFLSGGCVEAALIAEAQTALAQHKPSVVTYGMGGPNFDIKLPCGSRIDVAFTPDPDPDILTSLLTCLEGRTPAALAIGIGTDDLALAHPGATPSDGLFLKPYEPSWRLVVAGDGPIVPALCQFAGAMEYEVHVLTSDEAVQHQAAALGARAHSGHVGHLAQDVSFDPWTAFLTVFHDHDKEVAPLSAALASDCAYVGALGSRATHANRCETLLAAGISADALGRIHAPVGLDIRAATPVEIALSVMGEITALRRASPLARTLP